MLRAGDLADGGNSVETRVLESLTKCRRADSKRSDTRGDWFEEFRLYHRRDGMLVKLQDDLLSAPRYGPMMLRCARTEDQAHGGASAQVRIASGFITIC